MNIHEAIKAMREGEIIQRKSQKILWRIVVVDADWERFEWWDDRGIGNWEWLDGLEPVDVEATDWEVVKDEKATVVTH